MKVHEYKVTMTCDGCSGAVQRVLGKLKGKLLYNPIFAIHFYAFQTKE